jgi:hypothetical protein
VNWRLSRWPAVRCPRAQRPQVAIGQEAARNDRGARARRHGPCGRLLAVGFGGEVRAEPGPGGCVGVLAVGQVASGEPQERPVVVLPSGPLAGSVQLGRAGAGRDGNVAERGAQRVPGLVGDPDLGVAAQVLACFFGQFDQLIERRRRSPLPFARRCPVSCPGRPAWEAG